MGCPGALPGCMWVLVSNAGIFDALTLFLMAVQPNLENVMCLIEGAAFLKLRSTRISMFFLKNYNPLSRLPSDIITSSNGTMKPFAVAVQRLRAWPFSHTSR